MELVFLISEDGSEIQLFIFSLALMYGRRVSIPGRGPIVAYSCMVRSEIYIQSSALHFRLGIIYLFIQTLINDS
jgi:hypothetical protein